MANPRILGIDPGLTGGLALLCGEELAAIPMPVLTLNGKGEIDLAAVRATLSVWDPAHAWIEQQQAMPRQGVASSFRTGQNYGDLRGFLVASLVPFSIVRPAVWKKAMSVPADKGAAIAIATRTFPAFSHLWSRKKDDGVAEAALIAAYGQQRSPLRAGQTGGMNWGRVDGGDSGWH
jgi:crossover junction endodeoxyribonuclease RuvC